MFLVYAILFWSAVTIKAQIRFVDHFADCRCSEDPGTCCSTMNPRMAEYDTPPMKVNVNVQFCRHLEMYVSYLLGGRPSLENLIDRMINTAWPPGCMLLRPVIGDLDGTAFTQIFSDNFMNFPSDRLVQ